LVLSGPAADTRTALKEKQILTSLLAPVRGSVLAVSGVGNIGHEARARWRIFTAVSRVATPPAYRPHEGAAEWRRWVAGGWVWVLLMRHFERQRRRFKPPEGAVSAFWAYGPLSAASAGMASSVLISPWVLDGRSRLVSDQTPRLSDLAEFHRSVSGIRCV